jgi:hypothetical protein
MPTLTESLLERITASDQSLLSIADGAGVPYQPLRRWVRGQRGNRNGRIVESYDVKSADAVYAYLTGSPFVKEDPPLDCTIEEFRDFIDTLNEGDRVIERGNSGMTGETGTIVISRNGHEKCVRWDTVFREGTGMVTSITGGTRRLHP